MKANLENLKWSSVAIDGFNSSESFNGFGGLEECTDYGMNLDNCKNKQMKPQKRKKTQQNNVALKKAKLSNGFIVENCNDAQPSRNSEVGVAYINNDKNKKTFKKTVKQTNTEGLKVENMQAWEHLQIPEEILKGIAEQGFEKPTKIQELTLLPALLGRRDILGAAETGSGKTLAFGIPILAGILKLKEKNKAGIDVYDLPFKKSSAKKRNDRKSGRNKVDNESNDKSSNGDAEGSANQEIEVDVPLRKKIEDDDHDENDEDFIHLSDMLDSDNDNDSDEEKDKDDTNNDSDSDIDSLHESIDNDKMDDKDDDEFNSDDDEPGVISDDDENSGIGCVKVIDNIELPKQNITKTGKPLYALILTPTRELAMQITKHLIEAAKYTGIRIAVLVGGMAQVKQERVLSRGPEIVVATPGRFWELVQQGQPHLQQLDNIKFLAIDETDRMVERNHFDELNPLLERLNVDEDRRKSRQNFVFSATLTLVHELPAHMRGKKVTKRGKILNRKIKKMTPQQKVKRLIDLIGMTDPKVVDITVQNLGTAESLTECRITCPIEHKDIYLYYILKQHPGRTIVFCNSIGCVKRLTQLFNLLQCRPLPLHAGMPQRQRLKNLERFSSDPHGVLVATDVAARGLDIPNVDHVVHFQVPRTAENYVHRSGRTARATKEGLTILIMEPNEAFLYTKLCRTLNKKNELPQFPISPTVFSTLKQVVVTARDLERLQLQHRRTAGERGWLDRVANEMDIIVDEDFVSVKDPISDSSNKALMLKKKELETMLSKPSFPKGFSFKYPTLNEVDVFAPKAKENALQVMKNAIESGTLKKEKRKSKNSAFLKLQRNK